MSNCFLKIYKKVKNIFHLKLAIELIQMTTLEDYYNKEIKPVSKREFNQMTNWQLNYLSNSASFKIWKVFQTIRGLFSFKK